MINSHKVEGSGSCTDDLGRNAKYVKKEHLAVTRRGLKIYELRAKETANFPK